MVELPKDLVPHAVRVQVSYLVPFPINTGLQLSWSEHPAHNRTVLGSSPSGPTIIWSLSSDRLEQWLSKPQVAGSIPAVIITIRGCSIAVSSKISLQRYRRICALCSVPYLQIERDVATGDMRLLSIYITWLGTQTVKGAVCKTVISWFDSSLGLHYRDIA